MTFPCITKSSSYSVNPTNSKAKVGSEEGRCRQPYLYPVGIERLLPMRSPARSLYNKSSRLFIPCIMFTKTYNEIYKAYQFHSLPFPLIIMINIIIIVNIWESKKEEPLTVALCNR
ncbi:hypothetical protein Hanom_Chr12g01067651 [Helianthus anomalus]